MSAAPFIVRELPELPRIVNETEKPYGALSAVQRQALLYLRGVDLSRFPFPGIFRATAAPPTRTPGVDGIDSRRLEGGDLVLELIMRVRDRDAPVKLIDVVFKETIRLDMLSAIEGRALEESILRCLRGMLVEAITHELEECLLVPFSLQLVDGPKRRPFDPHKGGRP